MADEKHFHSKRNRARGRNRNTARRNEPLKLPSIVLFEPLVNSPIEIKIDPRITDRQARETAVALAAYCRGTGGKCGVELVPSEDGE